MEVTPDPPPHLPLTRTLGRVGPPGISRPYMPGYGTLPSDQGTGLLSWAWAEERLRKSRNYWLSTVDGGGLPHVMPVWAVWLDGELWFSSSNGSRKARNLRTRACCCMATDDPLEPVVARGYVRAVVAGPSLEAFVTAENEKYGTDYGLDTVDPGSNSLFALHPVWVFALDTKDFTGSPTRYSLPE